MSQQSSLTQSAHSVRQVLTAYIHSRRFRCSLIAPNETGQKIEVLADGQQICVAGIHPEVRKPYAWHGGTPWEIPAVELPFLGEDEARAFVEDAVELLIAEHGYRRVGPKADDAAAEREDRAAFRRSALHSRASSHA